MNARRQPTERKRKAPPAAGKLRRLDREELCALLAVCLLERMMQRDDRYLLDVFAALYANGQVRQPKAGGFVVLTGEEAER